MKMFPHPALPEEPLWVWFPFLRSLSYPASISSEFIMHAAGVSPLVFKSSQVRVALFTAVFGAPQLACGLGQSRCLMASIGRLGD